MADLGDSYLTHRPSPSRRATEVHCQHLALSHLSKLLDHLLPVYISTTVPLTVYSIGGWWRQWSFTLCVCKQALRTVPRLFPHFLCPASSFGWFQILWTLDAMGLCITILAGLRLAWGWWSLLGHFSSMTNKEWTFLVQMGLPFCLALGTHLSSLVLATCGRHRCNPH